MKFAIFGSSTQVEKFDTELREVMTKAGRVSGFGWPLALLRQTMPSLLDRKEVEQARAV
jgi:hypothetical protein